MSFNSSEGSRLYFSEQILKRPRESDRFYEMSVENIRRRVSRDPEDEGKKFCFNKQTGLF